MKKVRLLCGYLAAALLAVLLTTAPGRSQDPPQDTFVGEVEVTEVLLDVLVTDRGGQVIIGLGQDDFQVEEDGEPVEISGVTFYSSRELLGSKEDLERHGLRVDEIAEDRYFILFFHQQRRASAEVQGLMSRQMDAGRAASEWIAKDLRPRDMVAVVVYETRLEVVQDFTNNIEDLRNAVTMAVKGQGSKGNWPSRQPENSEGPSLLQDLPTGRDLGKATGDIYQGLQVAAKSAGAVRGRKNLLFFGRGIGETSRFGVWEPDSRYWEPTVEALNDNNVAVYTLNLMPLGTHHTLEQSLPALSIETGGTYYRQFTSFITPMRSIAEENGGYYLLSYPSTKKVGESGFQRVAVTTRNPELKVRARKGYLYGDTSGSN